MTIQDTLGNDTPENRARAELRDQAIAELARLQISPDIHMVAVMEEALSHKFTAEAITEIMKTETRAADRKTCSAGLDWCDGIDCNDAFDLKFGGIPYHQHREYLGNLGDVAIVWSQNDHAAALHVSADLEHTYQSDELGELSADLFALIALINDMGGRLMIINRSIQARRNEVPC